MKIRSRHTFFNITAVIFFLCAFNVPVICQEKVFNEKDSDAKAIVLADKVMKAIGGKKNWDATHYITWNFFGNRRLTWDKHTGNVRIENLKNDTRILVNINNSKGKVFKNGAEVTDPDSLAKYLEDGRKIWINDSYWLVMPFKIKDPGVTLKYIGEDTTLKGAKADVVRLTYKGVGVTPNNAFHVWINNQTNLIDQWAYYKVANQPKPDFVHSWEDYRTYGKIKLSGIRGERKISDVQVFNKLPDNVFTSFEPVDLSRYK